MNDIPVGLTKRQEKAFDFAGDLAKQLITLSTAIVATTTAFHKDIFGHEPLCVLLIMCLGWVFLLLCAGAGVGALMALTGALCDRDIFDANVTPGVRNVARLARAQVTLFVAGLSCAILYGTIAGIWYAH
jgi:hypothetical protein